MSAMTQDAMNRVAEFTAAHERHQRLLETRTVTLLDGQRAGPRRGVMGEWLTLAHAVTDTVAKLEPGDDDPPREDVEAALNDHYRASAETMRTHFAKPVSTAATAAITALRDLASAGEWQSSPADAHEALCRLELVAALADVAPMLDMHDPREAVGSAAKGTDAARFLRDVEEGRPSVMDPLAITTLSESLPFDFQSDGTPDPTITPDIEQFLRKQGMKPEAPDLFTWMVRAQSKLLSLANVITNVPSQRQEAAEALFTAYTKILFGADLLPQIANVSAADAKLDELGEVVAGWGIATSPPTAALKAKKGLEMAGVPLGMMDGLLKISSSMQNFYRASDPATAVTEAAEGVTQGLKLVAEAVETFGSAATQKAAKRALAYLALPLLAFELGATIKGLSDAVRNNDLSVAAGQVLLGIGAVAGTAMTMYAQFAVTAAVAGGPAGAGAAIAGGVVLAITLVGVYLVEFTKDPALETFAEGCAFGNNPADWTDAEPDAVQFGFGRPDSLNCATQTERLFSLRHPIGFTADMTATSTYVFQLTHGFAGAGRQLPPGARTSCHYIGDPTTETVLEPLPGFDDALFRDGAVSILLGDGATETPESWRGKWLRLEVAWADDDRVPTTIEYAKIP